MMIRLCSLSGKRVQRSANGPNRPARQRIRAGAMVVSLALGLTCARADTPRNADQSTQWHIANIHGHRIYYAVRGDGPTLVFLHGGGDSGEHSFVRQLDV